METLQVNYKMPLIYDVVKESFPHGGRHIVFNSHPRVYSLILERERKGGRGEREALM